MNKAKKCKQCGKKLGDVKSTRKFCSQECKIVAQTTYGVLVNTCVICGLKFTPAPKGKHGKARRCCSRACSVIDRYGHREEKKCLTCGKFFITRQAGAKGKNQKFCNAYCARTHRKVIDSGHVNVCEACGKEFVSKNRGRRGLEQRFCSAACGLTVPVTREVICEACGEVFMHGGRGHRQWCVPCRKAKGYRYVKDYRRRCFTEWGEACVACGKKSEDSKIHVHHIDGDPGNYQTLNLVPLCYACHILKVHKKKKCTCEERKEALFKIWPTGRFKIAEKTGIPGDGQPEVKAKASRRD